MNMKNLKWADDFSPVDAESTAPSSRFYTKAYLRHLFHVQELLAGQIATLHNLAFYIWLVAESRRRIFDGTFMSWKNEMVKKLAIRLWYLLLTSNIWKIFNSVHYSHFLSIDNQLVMRKKK